MHTKIATNDIYRILGAGERNGIGGDGDRLAPGAIEARGAIDARASSFGINDARESVRNC